MKKLVLIMILMSSINANAQTSPPAAGTEFAVAAGSTSKVYEKMFSELTSICTTEVTGLNYVVVPSAGTIENLSHVLNNEANAAFLHNDVIFYHNLSEKLEGKVQTLLALYPEEVHLIALRNSKTMTEGKMMGFGKKLIEFETLLDLKGHRVGAVEGGAVAAQVISRQGDVDFTVVSFNSGDEVKAALDAGTIDAWLTIGGAPLPTVTKLTEDQYKLLPINDSVLPKLQNVFKTAHLLYPRLSKDPVTTVSADAMLVVKKYKTPKMVAALGKFRKCFYDHLEELKETRGMHPKWQTVDPTDQGKWVWYELPSDAEPSQEAKQQPAKTKKK